MQLLPGHVTILAGSEDREIAIARDVDTGELPLGEIGCVVGEKPALQVPSSVARIIDLDPVRLIAIFVV